VSGVAGGAAPEISVVVPVRDGAEELPGLLASLRGQTLGAERFEVVVVDNDSRDSTGAVARAGGATVVEEPVANRSRARNRGAAAARADLIAYIDVDCLAEPGWLEALVACAHRAPIVAGPVAITTGQPPNAVERFEALWRFSQEAWVKEGWAAAANLLVHREAFDAVGGFDPPFNFGEDVDFCIRAGRAGLALAYCPDAHVTHPAERELRPLLERAFFHGYGGSHALRRLGVGVDAWRRPRPLIRGDEAMELLGLTPGALDPGEWRTMRRLARLTYAARVAGSGWAALSRAR
jgi:GT2 family glycosyltransferase